jgi:hypothetical protein
MDAFIAYLTAAAGLTFAAFGAYSTARLLHITRTSFIIDTSFQDNFKSLTHSQVAAAEDALTTLLVALECTGAILHMSRQGPRTYPTDLPSGALWRAVTEALKEQGYVQQQ